MSKIGGVTSVEDIPPGAEEKMGVQRKSVCASIRLLIEHPRIDPKEITSTLGIEPDLHWKHDDWVRTPTGATSGVRHSWSRWSHAREIVDERDMQVSRALAALLTELRPATDYLAGIGKSGGLVRLVLHLEHEADFSDMIPADALAAIAAFGADLGLVTPDRSPENQNGHPAIAVADDGAGQQRADHDDPPLPYPFTSYETDASGTVIREVDDLGGIEFGIRRCFWSDGVLYTEAQCRFGVRHGMRHVWNPRGLLIEAASYEDGRLHGEYRSWWDDGQLKEEGRFVSGRRAGRYVWYTPDGSVWVARDIEP